MTPFADEQLLRLTREIWTDMLAIPVNVDDPEHAPPVNSSVLACVHISGAWDGAVLLKCSVRLARKAAAAFLGSTEQAVSCKEMKDALGELANMTAGSIKPLVPGPSHISLPSVVHGQDYELCIPRGCAAAETHFLAGTESLVLSVIRAERRSSTDLLVRARVPVHNS